MNSVKLRYYKDDELIKEEELNDLVSAGDIMRERSQELTDEGSDEYDTLEVVSDGEILARMEWNIVSEKWETLFDDTIDSVRHKYEDDDWDYDEYDDDIDLMFDDDMLDGDDERIENSSYRTRNRRSSINESGYTICMIKSDGDMDNDERSYFMRADNVDPDCVMDTCEDMSCQLDQLFNKDCDFIKNFECSDDEECFGNYLDQDCCYDSSMCRLDDCCTQSPDEFFISKHEPDFAPEEPSGAEIMSVEDTDDSEPVLPEQTNEAVDYSYDDTNVGLKPLFSKRQQMKAPERNKELSVEELKELGLGNIKLDGEPYTWVNQDAKDVLAYLGYPLVAKFEDYNKGAISTNELWRAVGKVCKYREAEQKWATIYIIKYLNAIGKPYVRDDEHPDEVDIGSRAMAKRVEQNGKKWRNSRILGRLAREFDEMEPDVLSFGYPEDEEYED